MFGAQKWQEYCRCGQGLCECVCVGMQVCFSVQVLSEKVAEDQQFL